MVQQFIKVIYYSISGNVMNEFCFGLGSTTGGSVGGSYTGVTKLGGPEGYSYYTGTGMGSVLDWSSV
eukprot:scaffold620_cov169-Amphora_coffeaeformis.AAC.26